MKLLLKNLTLIDPQVNLNEKSDLFIEDGIIKKIGNLEIADKDFKIIDLHGKSCVPGFFDMHVHLREPGREDEETVETGCRSAAAGGFTGVACMPNTEPAIDSAEVVRFIKDRAQNNIVDVYPIGAVSLKRKGEALAPMMELFDAGAVGFSDDGTAVKTANLLVKAIEYSKNMNVPIIEHCEDDSLAGGAMNEGITSSLLGLPPLPSLAEDLTVARDILAAEYAGGKIHIAHISTKGAVELVRQAKKKGLQITAEVTPHHFTLTEEAVKSFDTNTKMNPPLRRAEDVKAILEGLKDGTIDCIASDHAPHSIEEKEMEFIYAPNGIVGLETEIGLCISELVNKNIISFEQLIEKLSLNPRKILNLPVSSIKEGEKANLTIIDKEIVWTVDIKKFKSKSKNSPFDKKLLTGKAIAVINNNKMYYQDTLSNI